MDSLTHWLTSLTLLPAGIKASIAIDKLADGVEATATVTGVHYGVLAVKQTEGGGFKIRDVSYSLG